jgi:anaerobic magnesium-protoporphyrin IX monomethyl ester cyclase
MTIDEVRAQLFRGFREFYHDKMKRFPAMPAWKQQFMKTLMQLLMEHSYLRDQMAGLEHAPMAATVEPVCTGVLT